jgi:hypothetical protein
MDSAQVSASDGFVLAMLGVMFLSGSVIALLIFCGLRNSDRRNKQVDDLLEEVAEEARRKKTTPASGGAPDQEPWERDGDWWKK